MGTRAQLMVWGFPLFIGESHQYLRGTQNFKVPEKQSFLAEDTKEEFPEKFALVLPLLKW
jgi:hypothetical protein